MSKEDSADDFLTWYCWERAFTAEHNYPPEEVAEKIQEEPIDEPREKTEVRVTQQFIDASEFFRQAESSGIDPVGRAEEYVSKRQSEGHDLANIDWTWYEEVLED